MTKPIIRRRSYSNTAPYTVTLDISEMYFLLEACFAGSHLRAPTIEHFVDCYYQDMKEDDRYRIFVWMHRHYDERDGSYKPREQLCGADEWFFARFDPNNQYKILAHGMKKEDMEFRAFKKGDDGKYYVGAGVSINPDLIISVEKLKIDVDPKIA